MPESQPQHVSAQPYRGSDRRGVVASEASAVRRAFAFGGLLLVAVWFGLAVTAMLGDAGQQRAMPAFSSAFVAASATAAVAAGALCVIRWRAAGDAAALWIGIGISVLGSLSIGLAELVPLAGLDGNQAAVLAWLRLASVMVAVGLLAYGLLTPEVDARLRLLSIVLLTIGLIAALTVALQVTAVLAGSVAGPADPLPAVLPGRLIMASCWTVLAGLYSIAALRRERPLFAWIALMLIGLASAEFTQLFAGSDSAWVASVQTLRAAGLLTGLIGATHALLGTFDEQSRRLWHSRIEGMAREARMRAGQAALEERAHEARNALTAIEGATITLERHRDQLDANTRAALITAVRGEIARLQRLVETEHAAHANVPFAIAETVTPQLTLAQASGARIKVDIPADLVALGRPAETAEVLQNLLVNAQRHGGGTPIQVRATREGERIVVRVNDRGPGVPPAQRELIFARGGRASDSSKGSGLGLYVSAELMAAQGGDLRLEDNKSPGACFALSLPVGVSRATSGFGEPADKTADGRKVLQHDGFVSAVATQRSHA